MQVQLGKMESEYITIDLAQVFKTLKGFLKHLTDFIHQSTESFQSVMCSWETIVCHHVWALVTCKEYNGFMFNGACQWSWHYAMETRQFTLFAVADSFLQFFCCCRCCCCMKWFYLLKIYFFETFKMSQHGIFCVIRNILWIVTTVDFWDMYLPLVWVCLHFVTEV